MAYSTSICPLPILVIAKATPCDYVALTNIWERSVRATHTFLTDTAILDIRNDVYDIYLHAMDVEMVSLVWDTANALPEQALAYTLPQKLMVALQRTELGKNMLLSPAAGQTEPLPPSLPLGFMGIQNKHIEMLFIDEPYHRLGLGKILIQHALRRGATSVDVNEQNPNAYAFYTRMGFTLHGRSPLDAQGNPFPILHLRREIQVSV